MYAWLAEQPWLLYLSDVCLSPDLCMFQPTQCKQWKKSGSVYVWADAIPRCGQRFKSPVWQHISAPADDYLCYLWASDQGVRHGHQIQHTNYLYVSQSNVNIDITKGLFPYQQRLKRRQFEDTPLKREVFCQHCFVSTVLTVRVDMATSFTMFIVFTLLMLPSPLRAAPNSLSIIQVCHEIHFLSTTDVSLDFQILYQEDETDELPTFDMTFEGDIVRRSSNASDPSRANAHLANPKMLWPRGVIEYKFYWTFPRCLFVS